MVSRWVPLLRSRGRTSQNRFKRSLVRNILFALLIISLFPVILIGTLNYFRTRNLLRQQATNQLENIASQAVEQLNQVVSVRKIIIDRLVTDETFNDNLYTVLNTPAEDETYKDAYSAIYTMFRANPQTPVDSFFDRMFIVRPDGSILFSTDEMWTDNNIGAGMVEVEFIRSLIGTNQSVFEFSPVPSYDGQLILFTSRSFADDNGNNIATLVTTTKVDQAYQNITTARSLLNETNGYYFSRDGRLVGAAENGRLTAMPDNPGVSTTLASLAKETRARLLFLPNSFNNVPVLAFAEWIGEYNTGILLEVPQQSIYELNNLADPFNVVLLGISLVISGTLIYLGSTRLVNPLVQLANTADRFSKGNWDERTKIRRNDEIGLLAESFNNMADELAEHYHSLEGVVERRTSQVRIASEVAQMATSTTRLSDTLGRTVELIAERFGFYHVAIYLFDEIKQHLILSEASGEMSDMVKDRGDQVDASANTLLSWVAAHNEAKILFKEQNDPLFRPDDLLPDTLSEIAIPVTIGNEVLGVLDIQSTLVDAFDEDTTSVFQTLANQISNTLQNTRLLESTQVSYRETILLYQATRQITQARGEQEIIQHLTDAFIQLPTISAILSVEGEYFKILAVTEPTTGKVDRGLFSLNIPTGRMVDLLAEDRTAIIEDISQPSGYENLLSFLLRRGCVTAALVGVIESGRLSKVFILGGYKKGQFSPEGLQPFVNLAEVVGASVEKHKVLDTLQHRLSELQILANFSQAISVETDLNQLYPVLHEQVMQTLGPDLEFGVAIYNQRQNLVEFPYYYEERQRRTIAPLPLGKGLTSILIETRKPLLLTNQRTIIELGGVVSGRRARSWMGLPLLFGGDVVGAIIIQDLENENSFNQDDLNLFLTLAPQIATAVRNAQLYTETQQALSAYDEEHFLLNTLLDNMPEGISFKDNEGRFIRASNSLANAYNVNAVEIIGKSIYDLMADAEIAEKITADERAVMSTGNPEIGLIQQETNKEGQEIWTHTSRIPIRTQSGDPYGLLLIQRDISELKRTEALAQQREGQVRTAAEIARDTTGTLDVEVLLEKSINLVRERFGFYHASIFLLDEQGEYAVLRESTGEAGRKMKEAGHRLAVGSKSIVGQVSATNHALIVNNVSVDPTHLPNPLLPDTRSELAIPMIAAGRLLGALDVQSTQENAFNEEDVGVLQILADQLAVAVVNGELFEKTQELLGKHRLLRQISIDASTSTNLEDALTGVVSGLHAAGLADRIEILMLNDEGYLQVQASAGYEGTRHLEVLVKPGEGVTGLAAFEKRSIFVDDALNDSRYININPETRSEMAIPILFSDELLGVLNLESNRLRAFDENDQEILGALGNNLGGVISNIRLVSQVRQQVLRERQLFDVTSKIRRSVDLETILETSAKEIARVLGARRANIRITAGTSTSSLPPTSPAPAQGKNVGTNGKATTGGRSSQGEEERS